MGCHRRRREPSARRTKTQPGTDMRISTAGLPAFNTNAAENRLIGTLGLQDQRFEYAFTDVFEPGRTRYGPGAGAAVNDNLRRLLGD